MMRVRPSPCRRTIAVALCAAALAAGTVSAGERPSADARSIAERIRVVKDNGGKPFAIIDKKQARLFVYDAQGKLLGDTAVLLGKARGDASVPGIGERKMAEIKPHERTTPAGRFMSEPGRNLQGEDIVWIDYDAAVSMHRVRANNKAERRLERLATATAADNRISYGCVNVPAAFYDRYVKPSFGNDRALIYVLPETREAETIFAGKPSAS